VTYKFLPGLKEESLVEITPFVDNGGMTKIYVVDKLFCVLRYLEVAVRKTTLPSLLLNPCC